MMSEVSNHNPLLVMGSSKWGPRFLHTNPSQDTSYPNYGATEVQETLGVLHPEKPWLTQSSLSHHHHISYSSTIWVNKPLLPIGHTSLRSKHLPLTSLPRLRLWEGVSEIYYSVEFISSKKSSKSISFLHWLFLQLPSQDSQAKCTCRGLGRSWLQLVTTRWKWTFPEPGHGWARTEGASSGEVSLVLLLWEIRAEHLSHNTPQMCDSLFGDQYRSYVASWGLVCGLQGHSGLQLQWVWQVCHLEHI